MPNHIWMMEILSLIFPLIGVAAVLVSSHRRRQKMRSSDTENDKKAAACDPQNRDTAPKPSRTDPALLKQVNEKLQRAAKKGSRFRGIIWPVLILSILCLISIYAAWDILTNVLFLILIVIVVPYILIAAICREISCSRLRKKFYQNDLPVLMVQDFTDDCPEMEKVGRNLWIKGRMQRQNEQYSVTVQFSVFPLYHKSESDTRKSYYTIEQKLRMNIIPAQNPIRQGILQICHDFTAEPGQGSFAMLPVRMVKKAMEGMGCAAEYQEDRRDLPADPEFEKYFEVRTDDWIGSRLFLTPAQMQTLCCFRRQVGRFNAQYTKDGITVSFMDWEMIGTSGSRETGLPEQLELSGRRQLEHILTLLPMLWQTDAGCRE